MGQSIGLLVPPTTLLLYVASISYVSPYWHHRNGLVIEYRYVEDCGRDGSDDDYQGQSLQTLKTSNDYQPQHLAAKRNHSWSENSRYREHHWSMKSSARSNPVDSHGRCRCKRFPSLSRRPPSHPHRNKDTCFCHVVNDRFKVLLCSQP